ncbi:hypothetical protein KQI84_03920 [bacterium]|nr:hypothetical protein [bacterium]
MTECLSVRTKLSINRRLSLLAPLAFLSLCWIGHPGLSHADTPLIIPMPQKYDDSQIQFECVDDQGSTYVWSDRTEGETIAAEQVDPDREDGFGVLGDSSSPIQVYLINSENLLKNPSMEEHSGDDIDDWVEEWTSVLNFYDTTTKKRGDASAKLLPHTDPIEMTRLYQDFRVELDTEYCFEMWVRTESVGGVVLGEMYRMDDNGGHVDSFQTEWLSGTNDWCVLRGTFNSGQYTSARIYLRLHGSSGQAWFDSVRVFRAEEGVTNLTEYDAELQLKLDDIPEDLVQRYDRYVRALESWQRDQSYLLWANRFEDAPGQWKVGYYVVGKGAQGRYYGMQSLRQVLTQVEAGDCPRGSLGVPYDFSVLDYPDYPVRSMMYQDPDLGAFFDFIDSPWPYDLSVEGRERLDYLTNLKLSEVMLGYDDAIGYGWGQLEENRLFSWNPATEQWDLKVNENESQGWAYWTHFGKLFDYMNERHLTPIIGLGFFNYAIITFYDPFSLTEGYFCNQIPFEVQSLGVATPALNAPVLSDDENLLAKGDFEEAADTSTYRNQSPIHGNNYFYRPPQVPQVPGDVDYSLASIPAPSYSNLEVTGWIRARWDAKAEDLVHVTGASLLGTSNLALETNDWTSYEARLFTEDSQEIGIIFPAMGLERGFDYFRLIQRDIARNGTFEYWSTSYNAHEWQEDSGGGVISRDQTQPRNGASCLRMSRSSAGMTRMTQDFISTPNMIHTLRAWVKHDLQSESIAYCEIYATENGQIIDDSYVVARDLRPGIDSDWYMQELTFETNSTGTFRIYLHLHGGGTTWFDDITVEPEAPNTLFVESFEDHDFDPAGWQELPQSAGADAILDAKTSGDGVSSVRTTGLMKLRQEFTPEPRVQYEARALFEPGDLADGSSLLPVLDISELDGTPILNATLNEPSTFQPHWRSFRQTFETGPVESAHYLELETLDSQPQHFDAVGIYRSNWLKNADFEYLQSNGLIYDWTEEIPDNISRASDPYTGTYGLWMHAPVIDPILLKASETSKKSPIVTEKVIFPPLPRKPVTNRAYQSVSIEPYTDYCFEAYVKTDSAYGAWIEAYPVDDYGNDVTAEMLASPRVVSTSDWTPLRITLNSREYSSLRLQLCAEGGSTVFDSANLYPSSYVLDGSFEAAEAYPDGSIGNGSWGEMWFYQMQRPGVFVDSADFHSGNSALLVTSNSGADDPDTKTNRSIYQDFTVPPWTTIEMSFWAKWQSVSNANFGATLSAAKPAAAPETSIDVDEDGSWARHNYRDLNINRTFAPFPSSSDWRKYRILFNTGRNTRITCSIDVSPIDNSNWSGDFWFDDVQVKCIPEEIGSGLITNSLNHDTLLVRDHLGNTLVEGTDYNLRLVGTEQDQNWELWNLDWPIGKRLTVSWNEVGPVPTGHSCPQSEKLYLLAEAFFNAWHADPEVDPDGYGFGLTTFVVGHDDIRLINLDGRSLSAGLTNSQQVAYSLSRLSEIVPEGCSLIAWADAFDRYHFDRFKGDFAEERYRAAGQVPKSIRYMPWDYYSNGGESAAHAENFARAVDGYGLTWVGTGGVEDESNWETAPQWMAAAKPHSLNKGACWATWRALFIQDEGATPPTYISHDFDGLVLMSEITWNHDGYPDGSPDDDDYVPEYERHPSLVSLDDLPYIPYNLNNSLGDVPDALPPQ